MNDRMSDMDALVELAARVFHSEGDPFAQFDNALPETQADYRRAARAALLAVGLPALLERVEAAEALAECEEFKEQYHEQWMLTVADFDVLAAKVARVEAVLAAPTMTEIKPSGEKIRHFRESDLRTALDASETP